MNHYCLSKLASLKRERSGSKASHKQETGAAWNSRLAEQQK